MYSSPKYHSIWTTRYFSISDTSSHTIYIEAFFGAAAFFFAPETLTFAPVFLFFAPAAGGAFFAAAGAFFFAPFFLLIG